jgi:hypothetical protein
MQLQQFAIRSPLSHIISTTTEILYTHPNQTHSLKEPEKSPSRKGKHWRFPPQVLRTKPGTPAMSRQMLPFFLPQTKEARRCTFTFPLLSRYFGSLSRCSFSVATPILNAEPNVIQRGTGTRARTEFSAARTRYRVQSSHNILQEYREVQWQCHTCPHVVFTPFLIFHIPQCWPSSSAVMLCLHEGYATKLLRDWASNTSWILQESHEFPEQENAPRKPDGTVSWRGWRRKVVFSFVK